MREQYSLFIFFFFFNDTATTEIYTLSLHDALPIRVAAAVRDPRSRTRAHHGLERGHQAARGPLHLDAIVAPHVDVGLPVGNDEHFLALQVVAQYCPERVGRPVDLALVPRPALRLEIADQRLEIARHRAQFAQGHFRLA